MEENAGRGKAYNQIWDNAVCSACGRYGNYTVFMTYTVLSLFFIPCFKWHKRYFVRMSCCGTIYALDPEVGKCVARGDAVEIRPEDLDGKETGWTNASTWQQETPPVSDIDPWTNAPAAAKVCSHCGYEAAPDFEYCPKCGNKL